MREDLSSVWVVGELLLLTSISFFESVDKYSFLSVCSDWILLKMIVGIGHNHAGRVFVFRCFGFDCWSWRRNWVPQKPGFHYQDWMQFGG